MADGSQTATKFDKEKNRLELLPPLALEEIGKVMTFGAVRYGTDNWRKGMAWRRLIGAALRHTMAFARGENTDPDTGICHLAHAACCILFLLNYYLTAVGEDDRVREP